MYEALRKAASSRYATHPLGTANLKMLPQNFCRQWPAGIPRLLVAREKTPERNVQNCQDKAKLKFSKILKSLKVMNAAGVEEHTDNSNGAKTTAGENC